MQSFCPDLKDVFAFSYIQLTYVSETDTTLQLNSNYLLFTSKVKVKNINILPRGQKPPCISNKGHNFLGV